MIDVPNRYGTEQPWPELTPVQRRARARGKRIRRECNGVKARHYVQGAPYNAPPKVWAEFRRWMKAYHGFAIS